MGITCVGTIPFSAGLDIVWPIYGYLYTHYRHNMVSKGRELDRYI